MPDSERERRLEEIHSAALKRDASERDEFLREACGGDAELRGAVESLLRYEPRLDGFLETPALETVTQGATADGEPSLVGRTLGPYAVLSLLGAGGMGEVYSARDTRLRRLVALKTLQPDLAADPERKRRLLLEAQAASALNDPHIVAIYDVGSADGIDFLVMEYVPGETLDKRIARGGLEIQHTLADALAIGDALVTAHKAGIIHRDLKPGNIMITAEGAVKVLDFGLAKLTEAPQAPAPEGAASPVSITGLILGTAAYMSPEQARGQAVDARSDIFSFGVVLYEMLTGHRPFQGADRMLTLAAIVQQAPRRLTHINPAVPAKLEQIVNRALEKDRGLRYQSAAEMLADLRAVPLPSRGREKQQGWGRRFRLPKPLLRPLAALILLLVAATSAWFYLRWLQSYRLTDKDTIVLADFTNTTGDAIFDGTLRQGLAAQLEQSPFLNLLSDSRIAQTLALMTQPKDARLTQKLAREICQRTASAATIEGSIGLQGSQYVLGLRAVNCRSGDLLAEEQLTANGRERVLAAMGEAANKIRRKLGESLASVQKYDVPLRDVTTGSLEALQAYTQGYRVQEIVHDDVAAIPLFQRAVSLDPNFAMAFAILGACYSNMSETARGTENLRRAYELRERASSREKFYIALLYDNIVTGNVGVALKESRLWAQAYPRDGSPHTNVVMLWAELGEYQKALAEGQEALRLIPGSALITGLLAMEYTALNRLDEARATAIEARNLGAPMGDSFLYAIDFLQHDTAGMERDVAALMGKPGYEDIVLGQESDTAAYAGRLARARELTRRAVASAERVGEPETAAGYLAGSALRDALAGNVVQAARQAHAALALSTGRDVEVESARALALAGDAGEAGRLASGLAKRFPENTIVQIEDLPTIQASIALGGRSQAGNVAKAIEALAVAARYELGQNDVIYLRGQGYLAARQGAAAAAEFQKILDHPGVFVNFLSGALAHLGLGRAYALAGHTAKARTAYQDFLALWKDADPDVPVLKQAKAEYAKLR